MTAIALAGAALIAACGDLGSPVERAFGSRQVLRIRDPSLSLRAQPYDSSRVIGEVYGALGQPTAETIIYATATVEAGPAYWLLDLTSGQTQALGSSLDWNAALAAAGAPAGSTLRYQCSYAFGSGDDFTFTVVDNVANDAVTITEIADTETVRCPLATDPRVFFWRRTPEGSLALWAGDYRAPAEVPLDLVVSDVVHTDYRLAMDGGFIVAAVSTVAVIAAPAASAAERPQARGLFEISLDDFAVTPIVEPQLVQAEWASGATAMGPLDSAGLPPEETPTLEVTKVGDNYIYPRVMSDGLVTMFATAASNGGRRELALLRPGDEEWKPSLITPWIAPGSTGVVTNMRYAAWVPRLLGWAQRVVVWDFETLSLMSCAVPAGASGGGLGFVQSPAGARLVGASEMAAGRALLVVSPERAAAGDQEGACRWLAERGMDQFRIGPDGQLLWMLRRSVTEHELWMADADGSSPRLLVPGGVVERPGFLEGGRVQLTLDGDLLWLDPGEEPLRAHHVADNVFGEPISFAPWLLTGYALNTQDETGTLGFVNLETGARRPVSPSVADFVGLRRSAAVPAGTLSMLYLVRGRHASDQDGLWLASFGSADLSAAR